MKRRTLLKTSLVAGIAASTGLIPGRALAVYPKAAFENSDANSAMKVVLGGSDYTESGDIKIKAPEIAENGSVVPVQVSSTLPNIETISIIVSENPNPMAASFNLHGSEGFVSTRIKMGKTSNVMAVVKSGGSLYATSQEVKVTIGGCGG